MFKRKGDRVPEEHIEGFDPKHFCIEKWVKDPKTYANYPMVTVQSRDFTVDYDTGCLYVKKSAYTSRYRWVGGHVNLWRMGNGWLRAEFSDDTRFKRDSGVDDSKAYFKVHLLYKITKVDDVVDGWWND